MSPPALIQTHPQEGHLHLGVQGYTGVTFLGTFVLEEKQIEAAFRGTGGDTAAPPNDTE